MISINALWRVPTVAVAGPVAGRGVGVVRLGAGGRRDDGQQVVVGGHQGVDTMHLVRDLNYKQNMT